MIVAVEQAQDMSEMPTSADDYQNDYINAADSYAVELMEELLHLSEVQYDTTMEGGDEPSG